MAATPPSPPAAPTGGWYPPPNPTAPDGRPLATFGDRALAYIIDYMIYVAITMPFMLLAMFWWFGVFRDWTESIPARTGDHGTPIVVGAIVDLFIPMPLFILVTTAIGLTFTHIYFVELQLRRGGRTIGKSLMKIAVVPTAPADQLSRIQMMKRWGIAWVAGVIVPYFSLLDGLWSLWDKPLQQCIHDKAAATVVVKTG